MPFADDYVLRKWLFSFKLWHLTSPRGQFVGQAGHHPGWTIRQVSQVSALECFTKWYNSRYVKQADALHSASLNLALLADGVFVLRSKLAFERQFTCSFDGERRP